VFVAGPINIKSLHKDVVKYIDKIIKNNISIIIGDKDGVDKLVQEYLDNKKYKNVEIFGDEKDIVDKASMGFIIWDARCIMTSSNIDKLLSQQKSVYVYLIPTNTCFKVK
jgi:hypothetical protein